MLEIKKLEEQIGEELHDAKKYIKCALKHKDDNKQLADLYYTLSNEEMSHMERLHSMVVTIIQEYRDKNGEPPKDMLAVYNYIHEQNVEKAREVKSLITMFKE